jgi:2-haloalkanoic acid dehalogenase type II
MTLDLGRYDALTFDCYGTLIDWETGLLAGLRRALGAHGVDAPDDDLLERYGRVEAELEAGPYLRYRDVLARGLAAVASELGVTCTDEELAAFGGSVADWPAFPDSAGALARLATRYRLCVITNCDDDLFAASNARLGVTFDAVVTAQQMGAYKPDTRGFPEAWRRLGLPKERVLHVAQSLFHDHAPARRLGIDSAWINRRHGRHGSGATPPAEASPGLTVPDMRTFADLAGV